MKLQANWVLILIIAGSGIVAETRTETPMPDEATCLEKKAQGERWIKKEMIPNATMECKDKGQ